MGDEADLQLFLVEHDLRGLSAALLAGAHQVLEEAVHRERGRGSAIRYVQRIDVPDEHRCLCLFQAPGPEAVRAVNDIAQFPAGPRHPRDEFRAARSPRQAQTLRRITQMAKPDSRPRGRAAHLLPSQQ